MQVPAYISLGVIAGCFLQPAFPGARPLIRWSRFPAVHLTSPPRATSAGNLPRLLATATTWPVPTCLPKAVKPTAGPKVLVPLPTAGLRGRLRRAGAGPRPREAPGARIAAAGRSKAARSGPGDAFRRVAGRGLGCATAGRLTGSGGCCGGSRFAGSNDGWSSRRARGPIR